MPQPILIAFAGPNGSGKSTIAAFYPIVFDYVNADEIQKELDCKPIEAARIAETTRERLLSEHRSFAFETVLSTGRNLDLMDKARGLGYTVVCVYVLTKDAKINVSRVLSREKKGGHGVPADKVISRYQRAMKLIPRLLSLCDECYIYDNSLDRAEAAPQLIVSLRHRCLRIFPNSIWSGEMLDDLIGGSYTN